MSRLADIDRMLFEALDKLASACFATQTRDSRGVRVNDALAAVEFMRERRSDHLYRVRQRANAKRKRVRA